ncbi:MAG: hypothetical protein ISEC1_P1088 [Thiomicrorhabdus sp.]|nr:MAG: hypothetical protein ISEC1_P1088 [Thiomicrorhabdus sp.]
MKKIVLCFDGTGNEPKDAKQEDSWFGFGDPEDDSISNVLKLHLLLGGDLKGSHAFGDQFSFYYSGVGTYGSWYDRLKNSFNAPPEEDVGDIIKAAMRDLYKNYQTGDQLFIFGFSRGAAIARRFTSLLSDTYAAMGWDAPPTVEFMGVFDTVAALKHPNFFNEGTKPVSDVLFENATISPLINKALHLLSLDERRIVFMPTLMNRDKCVTEVWFSGAHSDIGGGYRYDGLSDNTLQFMIDFIEKDSELPLAFLKPAEVDFKELFESSEELIGYDDLIVQPNVLGKSHEQCAITKIKEHFLDYRSPRVNINDKHSIYPPIIHRSVLDRMVTDGQYNPPALLSHLTNPYTGGAAGINVWEYDGRCTEHDSVESAKVGSKEQTRALKVGESSHFKVSANVKFNPTGILLKDSENEAYSFSVDMGQRWYDASIECGPDGWNRDNDSLGFIQKQFIRIMEGNKRHPDADWFEVIGTIGRNDRDCFRVLNHANSKPAYQPDANGELFVFANDLHSKYGNNRGTITITVTREA